MTILELREKRAGLVTQARALYTKAETEKRSVTKEENEQFDRMMAEVDTLKADIDKREKLEAAELELRTPLPRKTDPAPIDREDRKEGRDAEAKKSPRATPEYRGAFNRYLRGGFGALSEAEHRALSAGVDTEGGFTYADEQFSDALIKAIDDMVFIRGLATKETVTGADSLGVCSLDADPADADWTVELGTGSEDSTMAFGKRALTPHPVAKRIKVSQTLLRRSTKPVENIVRERLAYKFAVTEEKGFLTGTGANQPLGVFTASALGISTGRDVSTDNTTTAITADGLINALYSLKAGYQAKAAWIFHRDAVKMARKLKDGNGQYLWAPGLQAGQPDKILDKPFYMSEYAPNTFTTGLYVGIVGDFSYYWIVDALTLQIQRLVELYAETNQVGFIGRLECDGMPVLEEAFARVKLA